MVVVSTIILKNFQIAGPVTILKIEITNPTIKPLNAPEIAPTAGLPPKCLTACQPKYKKTNTLNTQIIISEFSANNPFSKALN